MSDLKLQLTADMKSAMKSKQKERLSTIRMVLAAIKQKEVDERITIVDDHVIDIISKMIKQRKDSAQQFTQANRPELAEKELAEIQVLTDYLPQPLSQDEIKVLANAAITATGAASIKDMGKVMGNIRPSVHGRADMGDVGAIIKALLQ